MDVMGVVMIKKLAAAWLVCVIASIGVYLCYMLAISTHVWDVFIAGSILLGLYLTFLSAGIVFYEKE